MRLSLALVAASLFHITLALDRRWWNGDHWVTIWGRGVESEPPSVLPPAPYNGTTTSLGSVVFQDTTIRQTFQVTLGASNIRLRISNEFSNYPLNLTAVSVALPQANSTGDTLGQPTIQADTLQQVTFSGNSSIVIPPSAKIVSDPINITLGASEVLAVSLYLADGQQGSNITAHFDSATTSWFTLGGDQTSAQNFTDKSAVSLINWVYVEGIEGWLDSNSRSLVAVGDSITDGFYVIPDGSTRWLDDLFVRMQADQSTKDIAIVNKGIGANTVLNNIVGLGALARIDSDVIAQPGVAYGLIFEGVNDIAGASNDSAIQDSIYVQLVEGYEQFVTRLHTFGIPVIGCTITPFQPPATDPVQIGFYSATRERTRLRVNDWIRNSGKFDAVVDFSAAVSNHSIPAQIQLQYAAADFLHFSQEGYQALADAFDLSIFSQLQGGANEWM